MDSAQENTIIHRAREGDREAFGELYDHYQPRIYRFVLLKVSSRDDAEDITHQVFMNAWLNIKEYRDLGFPFSSWLYRMARNQVIDHYRKARGHASIHELADEDLPDDDSDLGLDVDKKLLRDRLKIAILTLKSNYQDVLVMRFVEDMSLREVAKSIGKSEGAVKLMQHRATKELKKVLAEDSIFFNL